MLLKNKHPKILFPSPKSLRPWVCYYSLDVPLPTMVETFTVSMTLISQGLSCDVPLGEVVWSLTILLESRF